MTEKTTIDINGIETTLKKCTDCNKVALAAYVYNRTNTPLLKEQKITQEKFDEGFAKLVKEGSAYFCDKCDKAIYNKQEQ